MSKQAFNHGYILIKRIQKENDVTEQGFGGHDFESLHGIKLVIHYRVEISLKHIVILFHYQHVGVYKSNFNVSRYQNVARQ